MTPLVAEDTLSLPEVAASVPAAELYQDLDFTGTSSWPCCTIECHAIPSICRSILMGQDSMELTAPTRQEHAPEWAAATLAGEDVLRLPEIGVPVPVADFYRRVDLPDAGQAAP